MQTKEIIWLELDAKQPLKLAVPLHNRLLLESSIFLGAFASGHSSISMSFSDCITFRAFLKVIEYCWNSNTPHDKNSLGIFGEEFTRECKDIARLLHLTHFQNLL